MTETPNGRYSVHAQENYRRRSTDNLPERDKPRFSDTDVEKILVEGLKRALEMRDSEPTGVQTIENDAAVRKMHPMRPAASWWNVTTKTLTGILLIAGVTAAFWGGCTAARSEMDRAVTLQAAPIRVDVAEMKRDLRELLRRTPDRDRDAR